MTQYQALSDTDRERLRRAFEELRPALAELARVYRTLPQDIRNNLETRARTADQDRSTTP